MAEHAHPASQADERGSDWSEHSRTYSGFLHITLNGIAATIIVLVCLAIGGLAGAWWIAGFGIVATIVLSVFAFNRTGNPKPFAILLVIILVLYVLFG